MKARIALSALFLLAACQPTELDNEYQKTPVEGKTGGEAAYTLTLTATKSMDTKALELSGNTLNPYWVTGEKVGVYVNGVYGGSLSATAPTPKSTTATLSGSVTGSLTEGATIMLLYPDREDITEGTRWSYEGQDGALSARFDYATAELAVDAVDDGSHTVTTTGPAAFQNKQSIYRFGFRVDGTGYLDPVDFTIHADNTGLVRSFAYKGGNWIADRGFLSVTTPASKPADHLYYLSSVLSPPLQFNVQQHGVLPRKELSLPAGLPGSRIQFPRRELRLPCAQPPSAKHCPPLRRQRIGRRHLEVQGPLRAPDAVRRSRTHGARPFCRFHGLPL